MRKLFLIVSAICCLLINAIAQNRTITGKVTDDKGQPVQRASVVVKGTRNGTTTDAEGNFSLVAPASARTLIISSVDMTTQEVSITTGVMGIALVPRVSNLEGVVITGYTAVKKAEYAGSSSRVEGALIRQVPNASFDQILQGRVPGLTVLSGSGQPGSAATVTLRGPTSILSGSGPLYVVDGIPVEAGVFQSINVNDIESTEVLKSASATALYGSRGAAGVIIVTTRRGTPGKLKVTYGAQAGVTMRPDFNYTMMTSAELLKAQEDYGKLIPGTTLPGWLYSKNNPTYATLTPTLQARNDFLLDSLRNINTNWDDVFFRNGTFTQHDLSVSGGQGKTRMFSSLGYYNEQGIIHRSDLTRYTLRNNVDYGGDRFTASVSSLIGYTTRDFQESTTSNSTLNPFLVTRITPPYVTVLKPDGTPNVGTSLTLAAPTLLDAMNYNKNYSGQTKVSLSVNTNYKISSNWNVGVLGGADFRETQATNYQDPRRFGATSSTNVRTKSGSITESLTRFLQLTGRASLGYNNTFNEIHGVSLTGTGEFIQQYSKAFSVQGFGIDPRTPNTPAAITQSNATNLLFPIITGSKSQRALASGLAQGKYTYNKKYTLNASYRYDGSSILPEANRYHNFYSVGLTWDVKAENFMTNTKAINQLTFRADYGTSANEENFPLGDFGYIASYATDVSYNGNQGTRVTNPGNPDAQWEYTKQANIGVDFGFFNRRLTGSLDVYDRVTDNLFASQTLSAESGFRTLNVNAGSLSNKGIEWLFNFNVIQKKDFVWTLTALGAYNKNNVTSLGQVASFTAGTALYEVGKPVGSHYEVGWAGVDAATGRGLYYDKNGGLIGAYQASESVTNWGTYFAPWNGSFSTSITFKGFDISALVNYQHGATRVNNLEFFVETPDFLGQGFNQATTLDFWKKPGDQTRVQSPLFGNQFSSRLIQNADFFRLRNVTLSYTFPQSVVQRFKINNIRFYVLGQNLITWTHWKGYDPEDDNNISLTEYPNPRTITGGLQITF